MSVVNQELYCHNCGQYVRFQLDESLDGEHIIICPNCKHDHYRYINNGVISDQRWGQSPSQQQPVYTATVTSYATTSAAINVVVTATGTNSWTWGTYGTSTA